MKPAVFSPAARSRSRCSMGRRMSACVPVRKTRPELRVYLSSSVADSVAGKSGLPIFVSICAALWADLFVARSSGVVTGGFGGLSIEGRGRFWQVGDFPDGLSSFGRCFSRLRRALLSSCVAKKKVSKEEGDPGRRRALPGTLRYSVGAGAAELGPVGLRQSSPFSRPSLRCSASHKGPERRHGPTSSVLFQTLFRVSSLGVRWFSTSHRQRRETEDFAERARELSAGRSPEFRSAREDRVAQGTRAAGTDAGSPFLCLLSFGEAKESEARLKRENQHLEN